MKIVDQRSWPDIAYHAVITRVDEHVCDFTVFRTHLSMDATGTTPEQWFESRAEIPDTNDKTQDISKAQVYLHGHVKGDWCSDWYFDDQDAGMLHFCGKQMAADIGELFNRLYEWAKEVIVEWDSDP